MEQKNDEKEEKKINEEHILENQTKSKKVIKLNYI